MNEERITKEKMDAIKDLADTNIKISEAKNTLFILEEQETEYLIEREKKAVERIQKILEDSKNLIKETHENYEAIHQFCKTVQTYAEFLEKAQDKFKDLFAVFKARNELWEENARLQGEEIAKQKGIINQDAKTVKERENRVEEATKDLQKQTKHIESQQATLAVSYRAEKELFDKLIKK